MHHMFIWYEIKFLLQIASSYFFSTLLHFSSSSLLISGFSFNHCFEKLIVFSIRHIKTTSFFPVMNPLQWCMLVSLFHLLLLFFLTFFFGRLLIVHAVLCCFEFPAFLYNQFFLLEGFEFYYSPWFYFSIRVYKSAVKCDFIDCFD